MVGVFRVKGFQVNSRDPHAPVSLTDDNADDLDIIRQLSEELGAAGVSGPTTARQASIKHGPQNDALPMVSLQHPMREQQREGHHNGPRLLNCDRS
jgi:hypothetical protein